MWSTWCGEYAKICGETEIWLGGPEVSYDSREVLERLPQVKGVMKGEGEETFACLCRSFEDGAFLDVKRREKELAADQGDFLSRTGWKNRGKSMERPH